MSTRVVVATGPIRAAQIRGVAQRKLFRGVIRTLIRKTLAKIRAILRSDDRQSKRGVELGFTPALVQGAFNSTNAFAFFHVEERLANCLTLLEGQE